MVSLETRPEPEHVLYPPLYQLKAFSSTKNPVACTLSVSSPIVASSTAQITTQTALFEWHWMATPSGTDFYNVNEPY